MPDTVAAGNGAFSPSVPSKRGSGAFRASWKEVGRAGWVAPELSARPLGSGGGERGPLGAVLAGRRESGRALHADFPCGPVGSAVRRWPPEARGKALSSEGSQCFQSLVYRNNFIEDSFTYRTIYPF